VTVPFKEAQIEESAITGEDSNRTCFPNLGTRLGKGYTGYVEDEFPLCAKGPFYRRKKACSW